MGEAQLEAEAVDQRLERRAGRADGAWSCRQSRRSGCRTARPSRPRRGFRRSRYRRRRWPPRPWGRSAGPAPPPAAPARPAGACRWSVRPCAPSGCALTACSAIWAASMGKSRRAVGTGSRLAATASSSAARPRRPAGRAPCRGCAARRGRIAVGAARLGRLRQRDQQSRLGGGQPRRLLAEIGQASRRGCPRYCRHRAPASGRDRGSRPCRDRARARSACTIWRSLPQTLRVGSPSIRRATCMVSVEPPDTTRPPAMTNWLGGAHHRAPGDAVMARQSRDPRRRSAS